jgi:hypothetical protein
MIRKRGTIHNLGGRCTALVRERGGLASARQARLNARA